MAQPSWRKIESALIDLLREEGFVLEQTGGETTIDLWPDPYEPGVQINLGDFARELSDRIA